MTLRWSDLAEWRGPTSAHGGAMIEQRGMVIHIAEGSYEGTITWQKGNNNVSSHFVVAGPADAYDGRIAQVVDLDVTAWTQIDGNGHWTSVENSGYSPHALSPAQVEANARLYARGMREFGWPAHLATNPGDRGLAYHGLACAGPGGDPRAPWSIQNTTGQVWNHCDCPGAGVISQLPAILARAVEIEGGIVTSPLPSETEKDILAIFQALAIGANVATRRQAPLNVDMSLMWARMGREAAQAVGARLDGIDAALAGLADAIAALPSGGGGGVTAEQVRAIIRDELDQTRLAGPVPQPAPVAATDEEEVRNGEVQ